MFYLVCFTHSCLLGVKGEAVEAQDKKSKVADILSRNFNAFQKLSIYVEPVLGMYTVSDKNGTNSVTNVNI